MERLTEMFRAHVPGFEHCYISSIAPNLGVRETRRFHGICTLTVEEALRASIPADTICLSGYKIDIHKDTETATLFQTVEKPFGIPYGCLVSRNVRNLMAAGRNISATFEAQASTRTSPCCGALGHAAGAAAAMATKADIPPAQVNTEKLREILRGQNAVVD